LDICGVDVVCEGVHRPLEETGGGIVEVNAAPGLRMHLAPSYGKPRAVGEAIIDLMYAPGDNGRIPVAAVAGTNGKTTTVRLIAHMLHQHGLRIGMTTTDGVYVNGQMIDDGDCSGPKSARNVLLHPDVDAAVFETARGGILREGLGFDHCDVAVVTNIGAGDHLGLNYINLRHNGATVIADYGHNPDAMVALAEAVERIATGKRVVVISGAGDRRDEDIRRQTEILGGTFDEVILYQDACQRGRADGEVIGLLRQGLVGASRVRHVEAIDGEFIAIDRGLERLATGDLCLVLIDQVQEALAHLKARCSG
ncbi:MAG: hypothetical protein EBS54_05830, partial [Betaproteobacteria bacterium]|nr:hypothetical protein [Betaproteobacteria bacterium]